MYLAWVSISILVVATELTLWFLFRKRLVGLCFPEESDESFFRFFTRSRLKFITMTQAIVLLGIFTITTFFLW